jgi:hypothetical protein
MSNIKKSLSSELNNNKSKKINNPIKNFFNNLFKPFDEDKEEMTLELSKKTSEDLSTKNNSSSSSNDKIKNNINSLNNSKILPFSIKEWENIFRSNSPDNINPERLIYSLKLGINPKIRAKVWLLLSHSFSYYTKIKNQNVFNSLLKQKNDYYEDLIKRDINRTLLNKNKKEIIKVDSERLFNILKAYCIIDKEIGYCQGTNSIVATLMVIIGNNDELVFWTFYNIMFNFNWRDFFKENTPKLFRMTDIFKNNFKNKLKDLYDYFKQINFVDYLDILFTHFFLTIFTYNVPIELSARLFDLFWNFEEKVILDTIINIIYLQKEKIKKKNIEELIIYLKNDLVFETVEEYGVDYIIKMI